MWIKTFNKLIHHIVIIIIIIIILIIITINDIVAKYNKQMDVHYKIIFAQLKSLQGKFDSFTLQTIVQHLKQISHCMTDAEWWRMPK